jgi:AcrR family transcriptional regulator
MNTKEEILISTIPILAREGYAGTSMRQVAGAVNREASIIYAHFADKQELLRETRNYVIMQLARNRVYTEGASARKQLREMLSFQFDNREMIVALLQYFMAAREDFVPTGNGYIPARAYEHVTQILRKGVDEGVYHPDDIDFEAKVITHLSNGFLMEYFSRNLAADEAAELVEKLARYIERSLGCGGEAS